MSSERVSDRPHVSKASHDVDTPANLIDFMSREWIDSPPPLSKHEQAARFKARRQALSQAFPGVALVIPAGEEMVRANDTNFRFRTATDFAYLMGDGEPGAMVVLTPHGDGHEETVFVPAHNRGTPEFFTDRVYGELWVGRHRGVEESAAYFGVDSARPIGDVRAAIEELHASDKPVAVVRGANAAIDAAFPAVERDRELATHLSEMRLIKDTWEIAELRKACEITKRGFEDVIRLFPRLKSEREIEAAFWARARIEANDVGYLTIAAANHHACTLHWTKNDGKVDRAGMLLLDAGVECDSLYTADITRTLPMSGRYSAEQRAVYELVYAAQAAGIDAVRVGNDFLEPNRRAMRVLTEGLVDLGILKTSVDAAMDPENQFYRRYTLHGVSHMLGLDVHDCAKARSEEYRFGRLREGMVLTVEPGLYFQPDDATVPENFRGIGVRIEDDIVVTNGAPENLSAILPSRADDVEAWIATLTA